MALASQPITLPARRSLSWLAPAAWWHLLSLDAPTVAIVWAWSMARAFQVRLTFDSLLLLFAGTWLLYIADRILDGLHQESARLRERHFFYRRHRTLASLVALPVIALLVWLVSARMLPAARTADFFIFVVALSYFCLVHLRAASIQRWFPKEMIVALVFAAATAVPAAARMEQQRTSLILLVGIFSALCWLNCIAIEKWESNPRATPASDPTASWGQRHLRATGVALAAVAALSAVIFLLRAHTGEGLLCAAAILSATLLVMLDHLRRNLSAFHLRIAADAALLTPLLLFLR